MVDARSAHGVIARPRLLPVLLAGVLPLLVACGAASAPAASTGAGAAGSPSVALPSPDSAGSSAACGQVVVGGVAAAPMPAAAAGCLSSALRACRAARLVVVEQGVDTVRTDTLTVAPGGSSCAVTVTESVQVFPRPATVTTSTCSQATVTPGVLALSGCSDGAPRTFPSGS